MIDHRPKLHSCVLLAAAFLASAGCATHTLVAEYESVVIHPPKSPVNLPRRLKRRTEQVVLGDLPASPSG
jgi:hypothetical protein